MIEAACGPEPEAWKSAFSSASRLQTADSVLQTTAYCEYLLRKFDGDRRLSLSFARAIGFEPLTLAVPAQTSGSAFIPLKSAWALLRNPAGRQARLRARWHVPRPTGGDNL